MELVASWMVRISLLTTREDEELNVHDLRKCYLTVSFKQIVKRNLDFSFSVEKSEIGKYGDRIVIDCRDTGIRGFW